MRTFLPSNFNNLSSVDKQTARYETAQRIQVLGTYRRPDPPTNVVAQSGSRKALITWRLPAYTADITGWRIYKFTEENRVENIDDPSVTQCEVSLDAGATPPVVNIFVCSINARGQESTMVQVQASSLAEAGVPTDPTPPPGDPDPPPPLCFTPDTEVKTVFGPIRLDELDVCDLLLVDGKIRKINKILVHDFSGELLKIPGTPWGVTFEHNFRKDGWKPASELFTESFHYSGKIMNLEVDAELYDEQCFELGNGLVAHNKHT